MDTQIFVKPENIKYDASLRAIEIVFTMDGGRKHSLILTDKLIDSTRAKGDKRK